MLIKKLATGVAVGLSLNAYADGYYDLELQNWASIVTVSGGPGWAITGKDQYLYPYTPPMNDYFDANRKTSTIGTGGIYFSLQRIVAVNIIGQLGIGASGSSDALLSGVIDINGVPAANTYSYKVSHAQVDLKGKLIFAGCGPIQPYLSSSIGAGFNHSHDYIPMTIDPILYPPSWFDTNSNVAFSYTVGIGVQKMITQHWQVGVGYEFADWGKSFLGGDDNLLDEGPGSAHLYTNNLLFSLSYLF